ncbi:MAG: DNA polymerase III subunit delta, partial [Bacteroidota bacterium]
MPFSAIPGLHDIKQKLAASVRDGKVPHAMLFHGKSGALNLPLAIAFAAYLHCENKQ